jgi:hypothetical protein
MNIVIGRNNCGKSCLIDLVDILTASPNKEYASLLFKFEAKLQEQELKAVFPENTRGGELGGYFWRDHGKHFVGERARWVMQGLAKATEFELLDKEMESPNGQRSTEARKKAFLHLVANRRFPLSNRSFRRIIADRDITPETASLGTALEANGRGGDKYCQTFSQFIIVRFS